MTEQKITDGLAELTARRFSSLCAPSLAGGILETAFLVGAAVPIIDLLPGGETCLPLWTELCAALIPRGWQSHVVYDDHDPRLVLLPEGATSDHYDKCLCWWLTVESYGDGTVNIHGGAPSDPNDVGIDNRNFASVADALEALDG